MASAWSKWGKCVRVGIQHERIRKDIKTPQTIAQTRS